jgi:hypothetical protein
MKNKELRKLISEEIRFVLMEGEVIPTGPDGQKITDPKVIKGLNMALKSVDSSIRTKLIQLIEDPGSAKSLNSADKRAAMIAALAIAFKMTDQEFGQIITKVKSYLS